LGGWNCSVGPTHPPEGVTDLKKKPDSNTTGRSRFRAATGRGQSSWGPRRGASASVAGAPGTRLRTGEKERLGWGRLTREDVVVRALPHPSVPSKNVAWQTPKQIGTTIEIGCRSNERGRPSTTDQIDRFQKRASGKMKIGGRMMVRLKAGRMNAIPQTPTPSLIPSPSTRGFTITVVILLH